MTTNDTSFALGGVDGGRVHEGGDRPAVGHVHDDLLGPDRLRRGERLRHGELLQRELAAVGAAHGHDPQQIGGVLPRLLQRADDPLRLAVDGDKVAAACIEHGHADRGRVDERLQVAAGVLLLAVAAGIGDHAGGLGGEGDERLFVFAAELGIGLRLREADGAQTLAAVPDGGRHEGARARERAEIGQADGVGVAGQTGGAHGHRQAAEVLHERRSISHRPYALRLLRGHAGSEERVHRSRVIEEGDDAVAGAAEQARAVQHLLQDGVELEALVDAEAGLAEAREALAKGLVLALQVAGLGHVLPRSEPGW